jgi:acetyl-CoA synthetase
MWRLMAKAGYKPVIEYCGGTEIGGGYITSTLLHPNAPSQFSAAALGLDFVILNEAGQPSSEGELFLVPPSIGLSQVLLNASHEEVYYKDTPFIG